jgi:hypothetical protein
MIYKLICPKCHKADEHCLSMHDVNVSVPCEFCGAEVSRKVDRVWEPTFSIQGDTVPGGCSYDYIDGNLGVRVKSKRHRQDEMKRQGLREYAPDPELKAARDEAHYIRTHAGPNDLGAPAAAKLVTTQASKKKQAARIKDMMDKAPPFVLPD